MAQQHIRPASEVQELIASQAEPEAAVAEATHPYNAEISYLLKKEVLASLQQNNRERVKYAKWTFVLTFCWIFVVMGLVFLNGYHAANGKLLDLSDTVIITLITTTTINVFGFFLLVIKFLFNTGELAALTALIDRDTKLNAPEA